MKKELKAEKPPRKKFERPRIETMKVFETLALACCKADARCSPQTGGPVSAAAS